VNQTIDLRERERAVFRTRFLDGLVDIQLGLLLMSVWVFLVLISGRELSTWLVMGGYAVVLALVTMIPLLGKRYITAHRIGRMTPSPARQAKLHRAGMILAVLIVLQAAQIVLVGTGDWDFAVLAQQLVPGLMFALPLVALGYLQNFTRAYLYALFIGAGITWFVLLESPLLFLVTGILTFGIGIFIFLQFLHRYPRFEEAGERRNAR
jgi:hypothetical protein